MKYSYPISVVMPCYNYGRYVEESIFSILKQTFENFELIIINDGSTDDSAQKIKEISDKRIKYVELAKNLGNYPARNLGMRMATGKYIAVMDADDIALPDRLKIQFIFMEKNRKIGCIGSNGVWIDENGKDLGALIKPAIGWKQLSPFFLVDNYTLHPSLFLRKSMLLKNNLFYNETYKFAADFDFVSRCTEYFPVQNLPDRLLKYRIHARQISSEKSAEQAGYADQIRLRQLKRFKVRLLKDQKNIYLRILRRASDLSRTDLEEGLMIFNKLLVKNLKYQSYDQNFLHNLFNQLILSSLKKLAK